MQNWASQPLERGEREYQVRLRSGGNLTNREYPASGTIKYKYHAHNRVTNMVDAAGTTKYSYTALSQLLTEDGPWSSDTVRQAS